MLSARPGFAYELRKSGQSAELVGGRRIREWARQHGHKVADRGRIAAKVIEAYEKAAG
jgi:hypothetical protein